MHDALGIVAAGSARRYQFEHGAAIVYVAARGGAIEHATCCGDETSGWITPIGGVGGEFVQEAFGPRAAGNGRRAKSEHRAAAAARLHSAAECDAATRGRAN